MITPEDVPLPPRVLELIDEDDSFRLVIRAHVEISELLAMALESVFVDQRMPHGFENLGFASRLSLAISLGLLPDGAKELVKPLTDLRNELAHGRGPTVVSLTQAKEVLRPCRPFVVEEIKQRLKHEPPITYLKVAALTIYREFADGVEVAVAEREAAEKALAEARAEQMRKGRLSPGLIVKLLAAEDEGEGSNE